MSLTPDDAGELLRARGMRSTPQRRAILSVFGGGRTEHLAADEIYARASASLSDLSRATVYATLAEFAELGLLSAFGTPEPVRYETNLEPHAHLRCRLCLRIFDLKSGQQTPSDITDPGFSIERVETRAEGICDECADYDAGLRAGAREIVDFGPPTDTLAAAGAAVIELSSPLGQLLLAATPIGVTRVAFEDHHDADALRDHAARRRGRQAARRHLAEAGASLQKYLDGDLPTPICAIDWDQLGMDTAALSTTLTIPYATVCSYSALDQALPARQLGQLFGSNPIPMFAPCHRVVCGTEVPTAFVGGPERRRWLAAHEQAHS